MTEQVYTVLASTQVAGKCQQKLWRPFDIEEPVLRAPSIQGPMLQTPMVEETMLRTPLPVVRLPGHHSAVPRAPEPAGAFPLAPSLRSAFRRVKKKHISCPYCALTFFNQGQLSGHVRAHTGDKPFQCDSPNCGRSFARNEELTRHRRIHSGDKPHVCETCSKPFGRKDHLNKHRKTHLKTCDKKVYHCPVQDCGLSYTRSDALARHQANAHKAKPSAGFGL